ncbi:metallophosphoesterase [Aeromonas dhakensis]|uniref:metallophosphoesterase family protein n=1 Tax=Aeromonas TaxID=642 RepID=UPI001F60E005|nr:metallophosphoesterase [Aeromonas dhakensis]UNU90589.1 metallophosphoesterase [Aeromonas dhakensis]
MSNLRLLIISDLHAVIDSAFSHDSRLEFNKNKSEYGEAAISYMKSLDIQPDVLVCAGDISNKACKDSFNVGWNYINKIRNDLKIPTLLTVPGNHDHDSRLKTQYSPKHNLQFQNPIFPFECHDKNTHFWAWNWCHIEQDSFHAILLNTSAYHGFGDEHNHGRVAIEVASQIKDHLSSNTVIEKDFNLLLCHHHPEKMEFVDNSYDHEEMEGGKLLIDRLQEIDKGPWLIIHGHKHFASLSYASSKGTCHPVILSAGSLSARLYPEIEHRTSNQFYIIDIDSVETRNNGRLIGTINTFEWTMDSGWKPSKSEHLPAKGGFGCQDTPAMIAKKIIELFDSQKGKFLDSNDLSTIQKSINHLPPIDFKSIIKKLQNQGFTVHFEDNILMEIGK